MPSIPVDPKHAVVHLGLLIELYFSIAIQVKSERHTRKIALDIWNACATAGGLIPEPYLLRSDIRRHLGRVDPSLSIERLGEPQAAADYVFTLVGQLQRKTRRPLQPLGEPVIFEALMPPRAQRRTVVVVPGPGVPLPPEALRRGAFLCTPESLDLYVHSINPFAYWTLPPELLALGIAPPAAGTYLAACRRYADVQFLCHPGFGVLDVHAPGATVATVRHVLEGLGRGEAPPPIPPSEYEAIRPDVKSVPDYYRRIYPDLYREGQRLRQACGRIDIGEDRG